MSKGSIEFNRPPVQGRELTYLKEVLENRQMKGDGPFTKRCHDWLEQTLGAKRALLTHSCTAALEMSAILADVRAGDEVIMPSFTFVSTANAVALRGATPVFVDIRSDTLNIDETLLEEAITPRTKAIMVVHYAGVGCEMDPIVELGKRRNVAILEDAAQALLAKYKGRELGTIGELGSISFHETKNIVSGEGGALLINDPRFAERAEIIREKGTDRAKYFRGEVDKYTWVDIGSSFLPSEFNAAVLLAQLEVAKEFTAKRIAIWNRYHEAFKDLEAKGRVRRPIVPAHCEHNGHIYYLLAENLQERTELLTHLKQQGIGAVFHYIPLHSAPAGRKYGRTHGPMSRTDSLSDRLVRLPSWTDMTLSDADRVSEIVHQFYAKRSAK